MSPRRLAAPSYKRNDRTQHNTTQHNTTQHNTTQHTALHTQGIDFKKEGAARGAYAVVMAGGYRDDHDTGSQLWYTGEGGQSGKRQASDQKWEGGNLALRANKESGEPVRVIRGKVGPNNERLYTYEGLYTVAEAKMEPSADGPLVCRFRLEGVPGRHVVTGRVEFGSLSKTKWAALLLERRGLARSRSGGGAGARGGEESSSSEEEEEEEGGGGGRRGRAKAAKRPKKSAGAGKK